MNDIIEKIVPLDKSLQEAIQKHLDFLTKPPGSLGRLEELAMQYALIHGTDKPTLTKKKIFTFAGDHGVAAEGVSAFPSEVTKLMVDNMLRGGAAVNVLSSFAGVDVAVVDAGVAGNGPSEETLQNKKTEYVDGKVRPGSRNIANEPAMTMDETVKAINLGVQCAIEAKENGYDIIGTGEMGIANTTPSSALYATLLPSSVEKTTGIGTGVDEKALQNKIEIIKKAIKTNEALLKDPISTLSALGGFEIAAITGLILGGAALRLPVVVDGYISSAAALVACRYKPATLDYLFFSHYSAENGYREFTEKFNIKPLLDLQMRLGEGTGAALAINLIEASVKIYNEMATFADLGLA
ncbi:MAG: nicotinate-nucleotide--dimethylbenzimidazole phosphoribosyltransferase [Leptospirales bacterium]